jgi:hypothetical protein
VWRKDPRRWSLLVRVERGKARCRFHGGLSTAVERELLKPSGGGGGHTAKASSALMIRQLVNASSCI